MKNKIVKALIKLKKSKDINYETILKIQSQNIQRYKIINQSMTKINSKGYNNEKLIINIFHNCL